MNYYDDYEDFEYSLEDEVDLALQYLVNTGQIEMGLNEDGVIVYWMTDKQKADYFSQSE